MDNQQQLSSIKRLLDIVLSFTGLIIGSPLIILIVIAIRLESSGPVIFTQKRLGYKGKHFDLYKFRKFPANWGSTGPGVTVSGDARMTLVGKYLERTKLDELPQLWNILRGDMSFVGPRPESLKYAPLFTEEYAQVLDHVPGIFGPNQVAFRNESSMYPPDEDPEEFYRKSLFPKKAKADITYFSKSNLGSDIGWIMKGLWVSIAGVLNWQWIVRHILPVAAIDLIAIEFAWITAFVSRFGSQFTAHLDVYLTGIWVLPLAVTPIMAIGGAYRHTIRHIVLRDILRISSLTSLGWLIGFLSILWLTSRNTSLALGPLGFMFLLSYAIVPRIIIKEYLRTKRNKNHYNGSEVQKVLIFGTDDLAINLGSIFQRGFPNANLIGFLDNCNMVRGCSILNQKVIGSERDLPTLLAVHDFHQLWLASSPNRIQRQRLEEWTQANNIKLVIFPEIEAFESLSSNVGSIQMTKQNGIVAEVNDPQVDGVSI